jgi:CRISPR-associated protein Csm4
MSTYLYWLSFNAPVHFGSTGIGLEVTESRLASDSLTSALINAFAVLGTADSAISALQGETPAFTLSSLFPFGPMVQAGRTETAYALPRPLSPPKVESTEVRSRFGKDLKRVQYLTPDDFLRWINDAALTATELESIVERGKQLACRWDPVTQVGWWATELRPRVALDRGSQNSNLWSCGALRFHEDAGLYGLVEINDLAWKNDLETAFGLLGELGVGGERTYGMGTFAFSGLKPLEEVWRTLPPAKPHRAVLLSRYFPTQNELANISDWFEAWDWVESRGYVVSGRTTTTLKRQRVRLIIEGSVTRQPVQGRMVEVTPPHAATLGLPHRVYRSGLAFVFPKGAMG